MTPRKLRPLRELRRLRKASERSEERAIPKTYGSERTASTEHVQTDHELNELVINPRAIADIQVLVEASHKTSSAVPRLGFVAVVNSTGEMTSVIRVRECFSDLRQALLGIRTEIERLQPALSVIGLVDQASANPHESSETISLTKMLTVAQIPGKFVILYHSSSTEGYSTINAPLPQDPVNTAKNELSWSSWDESHKLSAFDSNLKPLNIRVA